MNNQITEAVIRISKSGDPLPLEFDRQMKEYERVKPTGWIDTKPKFDIAYGSEKERFRHSYMGKI